MKATTWRSMGIAIDRTSLFVYTRGTQFFVGMLGYFTTGAGPVMQLRLWRFAVGWWPSSSSFWWKGDLADMGRCWGPIRFWWEGIYQLSLGEHVWLTWDRDREKAAAGYTWPRILRRLERWWFHYRGRRELDLMVSTAKRLHTVRELRP